MAGSSQLDDFLNNASITPEVSELCPSYRVLLVAVDGLPPQMSSETSEKFLTEAEASAREAISKQSITDIPHVAAWREAYKAFGAKPQKTRNSLEALLRRVETGLPRVNPLTDIYNAVSIKHQIPLGGEDISKYIGPLRLIRATGKENFEVISKGETVVEHPDKGEVVWCDDAGVTCRRWNWRQCQRTALTDSTTSVIFIFDALAPMNDDQLNAAGDDLCSALQQCAPNIQTARRLIGAKQ